MIGSILLRAAQSLSLFLPFAVCGALLWFVAPQFALSVLLIGVAVALARLIFQDLMMPLCDYFARYIDPITSIVLSALIALGYFAVIFPLGAFNPSARRRFRSSRSADANSYWERPSKV